jgi:hypothetical protein
MPPSQRRAYVMDVINALGLAKAKHTIIGKTVTHVVEAMSVSIDSIYPLEK